MHLFGGCGGCSGDGDSGVDPDDAVRGVMLTNPILVVVAKVVDVALSVML